MGENQKAEETQNFQRHCLITDEVWFEIVSAMHLYASVSNCLYVI